MSFGKNTGAVSLSAARAAGGTALVFFFALLSIHCRDDRTPAGPHTSLSFTLAYSPGDILTFDAWDLDAYGYIKTSTHTVGAWRVIAASQTRYGRPGVTVILDSIVSSNTHNLLRDTIYYQVDAAGDLYQYGFLSSIAQHHSGAYLAPTWDRIGGFSLGSGSSWTVGVVDTLGSEANAILMSVEDLTAVPVNGATHIFPSYFIQISAPDVQYSFHIASGRPACVPDVVDESGISSIGYYHSLSRVSTFAK